jgi:hypothetical protein
MKKLFLGAFVLFCCAAAVEAGFNLGMLSAVKSQSQNLDIAVANKKASNGSSYLGNVPPGMGSGPITFSTAPVAAGDFLWIVSLGNLNPPGHTLPTDHIYFYYADPAVENSWQKTFSIYAPANGVITELLYQPSQVAGGLGDYKVTIVFSNTFGCYFDHVTMLDNAIASQAGTVSSNNTQETSENIPVKAGQRIGMGGNEIGTFAFDLGVDNLELTLPFINPAHYHQSTVNADAPLKYFAEPIKSALYAKVTRYGSDKDGKVCYDVPGRLIGGWFLTGAGPDDWSEQMAFAYDAVYSTYVMVSCGGTLGITGTCRVQDGAIPPENISTATGPYGYQFQSWDPSTGNIVSSIPRGLLMVQMIDDNTIKVEYFPDNTGTTMPFDANAKIYVR